jgi:hypothetical protein
MLFTDIRQKSLDLSFGTFFPVFCLVQKIHSWVLVVTTPRARGHLAENNLILVGKYVAILNSVLCKPMYGCALTFSPPTFSPSDNSTHTVGPSDNWTLEHFGPHLFGPCIV